MHLQRWFVTAALLALWSLSATAASAQTTLRYKFKEGEKLQYIVDQKMKMSMDIMGKSIDMNMDQSSEMGWIIGSVDDAGNAKITMKFGRTKMKMDSPMGKIEVDSASTTEPEDQIGQVMYKVVKGLADLEIGATMSPQGDYKDLKIPEKAVKALQNLPGGEAFGDMFSPDGLKRMMSQSGLVLPKDALSKGKTWSAKNDMKLPFGKMIIDMDYTYDGPTEKDGRMLEKILLKPKAKIDPDPNSPFQMTVKSQQGTGTALFDNAAGRLLEVTTNQTMEMAAELMGNAINMKMTQTMKMRLADKK